MAVDLQSKKQELETKRNELQKRLNDIQSDYKKGLSADAEEQAIELENAEVLEEISRITHEELQKINTALERIEFELR